MPLIIVTGKPCTGKTSFAESLVTFLKNSGKSNVELVNEESLHISKKDGYKSSFAEKGTRGALKGASDHKLNTECFVVVDSLNYIKGYRYELYCTARTFRTPHCVVWVGCNDSTASKWNDDRISNGKDAYDPKIMEDLRMRYEAPNEANRWDFPLFKVTVCTDQAASVGISTESVDLSSLSLAETPLNNVDGSTTNGTSEALPVQDTTAVVVPPVKSSFTSSWKPKKKVISAAAETDDTSVFTLSAASVNTMLTTNTTTTTQTQAKAISFSGTMVVQEDTAISGFMPVEEALVKIAEYFGGAVAAAPNSSTIAIQRANADLLYELDRVSQQVIQIIVAHQTEGMVEGTPLKFVEYDRALTLNRHTGLAELQRYRRQYVKINGQHPPTSSKAIGTSFIDFLALHI